MIRWTHERAAVLTAVYATRIALMCSRYGEGPRPWPRTREECGDALAWRAVLGVSARGGLWRRAGLSLGPWTRVRRMSPMEWAEVYWKRRAGPLKANAEARRAYFHRFAYLLLTEG
ncbi:MAG TPA: hypothetical protein VFR62_10070, partial [Gemmatimonadales bacterium]|nr:hypothetical protein [Gemmatimonadales bacterium]